MVQALLFEKKENLRVQCALCAHRCLIDEGKLGICRVRKNINGTLFSLNSDRVAAVHLDPIEKKPLYHFYPGSRSYSLAAMGCNFSCEFCQNYSLSQVKKENHILGEAIEANELVAEAIGYQARSISYTYSEPTIFFELMYETARLAKEKGLTNVMVTNGYMSPEALDMMAPFLDAANVDLKAFSDDFYRKYCHARLAPVLETIRGMKKHGVWVEVTTLLIPGLNTDLDQTEKLVEFIASVDVSIPWHVSRFFPQYLMQNVSITPADLIFNSLEIGRKKGLQFVYSGNIADAENSDTHCPACKNKLIGRSGYQTEIVGLAEGNCQNCGQKIAGIW